MPYAREVSEGCNFYVYAVDSSATCRGNQLFYTVMFPVGTFTE